MGAAIGLRRAGSLAALLAAGVGAVTLAACGGGATDPEANGKAKFAQSCGGCHMLAAAGTIGTIGPNLDDAFRGARRQGFEQSSFEGIIRYWIANPEQRTEPKMQPNLVTGKDAEDVAAYVASVAGRDAESPPRPAEPIE